MIANPTLRNPQSVCDFLRGKQTFLYAERRFQIMVCRRRRAIHEVPHRKLCSSLRTKCSPFQTYGNLIDISSKVFLLDFLKRQNKGAEAPRAKRSSVFGTCRACHSGFAPHGRRLIPTPASTDRLLGARLSAGTPLSHHRSARSALSAVWVRFFLRFAPG